MNKETLVTLTADIVAAHVANNSVAIADLGAVIQRVHEALSGLEGEGAAAAQPKEPVVSVRSSIKPDYLICMECGAKQKMLKRHLMTAHGMTPEEYRRDYGLPGTYPMAAPNYSKRRSDLAKASGLGTKRSGSKGGSKGAAKAG